MEKSFLSVDQEGSGAFAEQPASVDAARDKAMLELLYATGIRYRTHFIDLDDVDLNTDDYAETED